MLALCLMGGRPMLGSLVCSSDWLTLVLGIGGALLSQQPSLPLGKDSFKSHQSCSLWGGCPFTFVLLVVACILLKNLCFSSSATRKGQLSQPLTCRLSRYKSDICTFPSKWSNWFPDVPVICLRYSRGMHRKHNNVPDIVMKCGLSSPADVKPRETPEEWE